MVLHMTILLKSTHASYKLGTGERRNQILSMYDSIGLLINALQIVANWLTKK